MAEAQATVEQKKLKDQTKDIWKKNLSTQRVEQNVKAIAEKQGVKNQTQAQVNVTALAKAQRPIPKELSIAKEMSLKANVTAQANQTMKAQVN